MQCDSKVQKNQLGFTNVESNIKIVYKKKIFETNECFLCMLK